MKPTLAITGASGFVGSALLKAARSRQEYSMRALLRSAPPRKIGKVDYQIYDDLAAGEDCREFLSGVDTVIHTAARVHVMRESERDALSAYRAVNVTGTLSLANQAANIGVRRFIFISSIKVNGEETPAGKAFTAKDVPNPQDDYAISKAEAERGLFAISRNSNMQVVCIRPPLIYGPGVKGNFLSLLNWLSRDIPLPLGAVNNKRSLVALDNLIDLILTCVYHPAAANQIFLVSDDEDISTSELLQRAAKALGQRVRLWPVPTHMLALTATICGKRNVARRLLGNMQLDIASTKKRLDWQPPVSFDEAMKKTAKWYLAR